MYILRFEVINIEIVYMPFYPLAYLSFITFLDRLSFEPELPTVLLNLSNQANICENLSLSLFINEMKTALTQWTLF